MRAALQKSRFGHWFRSWYVLQYQWRSVIIRHLGHRTCEMINHRTRSAITPIRTNKQQIVFTQLPSEHTTQWRPLLQLLSASTGWPNNISRIVIVALILHCLTKKVSTFKLPVTYSNLNRFSNFLHCWKAYEICYKTHTSVPTSLYACSMFWGMVSCQ